MARLKNVNGEWIANLLWELSESGSQTKIDLESSIMMSLCHLVRLSITQCVLYQTEMAGTSLHSTARGRECLTEILRKTSRNKN